MNIDIKFRAATADDMPYIYDSFRLGAKDSPWLNGQSAGVVLGALIVKPEWKITIAQFKDVPEEIIGWLLWKTNGVKGSFYEPTQTVAWLCIKGPAMGNGIGHALLDFVGCDLSKEVLTVFTTSKANAKAHEKGIKLRLRPYMVL